VERKEIEQFILEALQDLPERRRLIYNMSRRYGLTYREIAARLDISVKTVETQMSRALRFLRERLSSLLTLLSLILTGAGQV
jgi:RNA polymerase sigma-70 factor (ECF subfamily)